ncbi:hypothetical protein JCGZ_20722 [Jatropha curcas]|uniref:Phytocyanin domain-containing protein n=1 Tax=Jatropha curcas TaxID=180498 RepID=A0A067JNK5_JATCU|nr:blue copper protein 1b [Jatropha curcas]KDP25566.1 hypothetical protein JCGZ_20722 [Jatropha curcas]
MSFKMCMFIATIALFIPSILATDFIVGDETGWTTNFDYQAWAERNQFHVGDRLVFRYKPGSHNVLRVDGNGFQQCMSANGTVALTTGEDIISLATPGKKWYICGVPNHCEPGNMKLTITVLPQLGSPAVSPSPTQNPDSASAAPSTIVISGCHFAIASLILAMIMV